MRANVLGTLFGGGAGTIASTTSRLPDNRSIIVRRLGSDDTLKEAFKRRRSSTTLASAQLGSFEAPAPASAPIEAPVGIYAITFLKLIDRLTIDEKTAARLIGHETPDVIRALRVGRKQLATIDERDRVDLFVTVCEGVHALLRNAQAERDWLRAPQPDFDGNSLLERMGTNFIELFRVTKWVESRNGR
jgi:hypothetical protein